MSKYKFKPEYSADPRRWYVAGDIHGSIKSTGYYFWSENWISLYGPYATIAECNKALSEYRDTKREICGNGY